MGKMVFSKVITLFLGVSMFMFGILKFVNPFKSWYTIQVVNSGLGKYAYWMGISGEIFVGLTFLLVFGFYRKMSQQAVWLSIVGASVLTIIMMVTGIYVHLQPNVPAEVLPLKIKPPFIPGLFLGLAMLHIFSTKKISDPE